MNCVNNCFIGIPILALGAVCGLNRLDYCLPWAATS